MASENVHVVRVNGITFYMNDEEYSDYANARAEEATW